MELFGIKGAPATHPFDFVGTVAKVDRLLQLMDQLHDIATNFDVSSRYGNDYKGHPTAPAIDYIYRARQQNKELREGELQTLASLE